MITLLRHPLYAMWIHIGLGLALVSNNVVTWGCVATLIGETLIWTRWEENELERCNEFTDCSL